MAYQGPVSNKDAEQGVSSIPYVGPIISALISIGDFQATGQHYAWGQGIDGGTNHTEAVPNGFVEGRDYYWEYGTWKYSGLFIQKWKIATQLLGGAATNLDPGYVANTDKDQLQADLLSTQPATQNSTFIPPISGQVAVYAS